MASHWFENEEYDKPSSASHDPFGPLPLAYRRWLDRNVIRYKVYSEPGKYTMVLATTAAQAIRDSGIEKPLKVERYLIDNQVEAPEDAMTDTEGVYVRPLLEKLADESPVVEHATMQALIDESPSPVEQAELPELSEGEISGEGQEETARLPEAVAERSDTGGQFAGVTIEPAAHAAPRVTQDAMQEEAAPDEALPAPPSLKSILEKEDDAGLMPDLTEQAEPVAVPKA
jgi:hypothetical protein